MKKVIVFLILIFSLHANAQDFSYYCSQNQASKSFSGGISSLSGLNLFARNVAESLIEKEIKKETGAKFKVKINNFFANNVLGGEFSSLSAYSKKYEHQGIYLKDIKVKTICPYNAILFEDENLSFKENMVLNFSAKLDENDLKKTLKSQKLNKKLAKILSKISKYDLFMLIINSALPLTFPIKIDKNNNGKMQISKIEMNNKILTFDSYILIYKNK